MWIHAQLSSFDAFGERFSVVHSISDWESCQFEHKHYSNSNTFSIDEKKHLFCILLSARDSEKKFCRPNDSSISLENCIEEPDRKQFAEIKTQKKHIWYK